MSLSLYDFHFHKRVREIKIEIVFDHKETGIVREKLLQISALSLADILYNLKLVLIIIL